MMIDATGIERYREIGPGRPTALSLVFEISSDKK